VVGYTTKQVKHVSEFDIQIWWTRGWKCRTQAAPSCDIFNLRVHHSCMSHSLPCISCIVCSDYVNDNSYAVQQHRQMDQNTTHRHYTGICQLTKQLQESMSAFSHSPHFCNPQVFWLYDVVNVNSTANWLTADSVTFPTLQWLILFSPLINNIPELNSK